MLQNRRSPDQEIKAAHLYSLPDGFLYTASRVFGGHTKRHPWVLLLSLSGKPFTLRVQDVSVSSTAALIGPRVKRSIKLQADGIASLNVEPSHYAYNSLSALNGSGCFAVPGSAFDHLLPTFLTCLEGAATSQEVIDVFDAAISIALTFVRKLPAPRDPRISALVDALLRQSPLDYEFAEAQRAVKLSPGRLSHMFTDQVGLSLRSFLLWRKTKEALGLLATPASVTKIAHEAGFSDSAHLARTFQSSIGLLPSMLGRSRHIQVHDLHGQ